MGTANRSAAELRDGHHNRSNRSNRSNSGRGVAYARAALAGNPSDGYGGAVLAFTFAEQQARALATPAPAPAPAPAVDPPAALMTATVERFASEFEPAARNTAIRWSTEIPRGVGLGGSSAIIIATLRALCDLYDVSIDRRRLAALALAIETDELGIAAGLQDRVAQTHGGITFMDFGSERRSSAGHGHYERLHPASLPALLVAWCTDAPTDSGGVHAPLRERFDRGEQRVLEAMSDLALAARSARSAVIRGDVDALAQCANRSFDARRRMLALHPRHVELIECARAAGAGANYTGSGGAIVAVCRDDRERERALTDLAAIGAKVLVPTIATA